MSKRRRRTERPRTASAADPEIESSAESEEVLFELKDAPEPSLNSRRRKVPRKADPEVIHRGQGYAVLFKPAGYAVSAERNRLGKSPLLNAAARILGVETVLPVHRLDRDTSGCLIIATDPEAHRVLCERFRKRQVKKSYLAITQGQPEAQSGTIDAPLERDPRSGSFMRIARPKQRGGPEKKAPKRSITRYRVLVAFRRHALLLLEPHTGRQHQIRVHLRHLGHPLAVDPAYGGGERLCLSELKRDYRTSKRHDESPIIDRLTLHAWKLEFLDPQGITVRARAPLPKDLRRAVRELLRHASNSRRETGGRRRN